MENKVLIDPTSYPVSAVLEQLLKDKTTKKNIIFATDTYSDLGSEYSARSEITAEKLLGFNSISIQPRVLKSLEDQQLRTRKNAEVFTPSWICNKMNNHCDEEWFGVKDVFNTEDGQSWVVNKKRIRFSEGLTWKDYIESKRIEITCGEAPYIVSRYDAATGEYIPPKKRIGILDRKLRVINENVKDEKAWLLWVIKAFQSVYGYEYPEIIYEIAKSYILGFSKDIPIEKHNLKLGDALPHAKDGTLEEWLDKVFKKEDN